MDIIFLVVVLIIVGVMLLLVNRFIPMDPTIKNIINIVVVVAVVLWVVMLLAGSLHNIHVGR